MWCKAWHSTHKPSRCFYTSVAALRQTCSVAMLRQPDRSVISLRIHFKFPRAQVLRLVLEKLGHPVDHDPCSQLAAYILRLLACSLQFVCIPVPVCSHASCMRSPTRAHSAWATNGTMRQACSRGLVVLRLLTRIRYRLHWPTGNNICRFLLCLALELKITSIHW